MTKYTVWVSFPIVVETADELEAEREAIFLARSVVDPHALKPMTTSQTINWFKRNIRVKVGISK